MFGWKFNRSIEKKQIKKQKIPLVKRGFFFCDLFVTF